MNNKKNRRQITKIIIFLCVALVALFIFFNYKKTHLYEDGPLPQFIQADWIDLSRIESISKFRSGMGHDFSGNGETCRSMKHYFNSKRTQEDHNLIDKNNGSPPPFSLGGAIPIYSPIDGKIISIYKDGDTGVQIFIQSSNYPEFTVRLFHIFILDGLVKGTKLKAGEHIGNIGRIQNTDIAIAKGWPHGKNFVSYFDVMPDALFAKYQSAGIKNREEIVLTKEYRDANPLKCNGEQFVDHDRGDPEDTIIINQN